MRAKEFGELHLELFLNHISIFKLFILDLIQFEDEVQKSVQPIIDAWSILKYFDVQSQMLVQPSELLRQGTLLSALVKILAKEPVEFKMIFYSNTKSNTLERWCFPVAWSVFIGHYRVIVSLGIFGIPKLTGLEVRDAKEYSVETQEIEIVRAYVESRDIKPRYSANSLIELVVNRYQDKMTVLVDESIKD